MKIAVVLTGGLDSAVLLDSLIEKKQEPVLLYLDRGKDNHEFKNASDIAELHGLSLERLQVEGNGLLKGPKTLINIVSAVSKTSKVLDFDSVAFSFESSQVKKFKVIQTLFKIFGLFSSTVSVKAPLLDRTKTEIIKEGSRLGTAFELTRSCDHDGVKHCGVCDGCKERQRAFTLAEVPDPTDYSA